MWEPTGDIRPKEVLKVHFPNQAAGTQLQVKQISAHDIHSAVRNQMQRMLRKSSIFRLVSKYLDGSWRALHFNLSFTRTLLLLSGQQVSAMIVDVLHLLGVSLAGECMIPKLALLPA
jgi:hypothetical protein